ncbi:conserved hypothetical protein [Frankia sp. Hr75.2]|nr:conserved hypothetical protein [Frankia sp. Hr75.2]
MTTIAVTGHMNLEENSVPLVRAALDDLVQRYSGDGKLIGVSCVAEGADAIFADAVLTAGGQLVVIIPSRDYRLTVVRPHHASVFDRLVEVASEVVILPFEVANQRAYEAANAALLARADRLVAVWNGEPPSSKGGGTADAVLQARAAGIPVDVVWPAGAMRQS